MFWRLKELCSTKDAAAANEQRLGAELSTVWFSHNSLSPCFCNVCVFPSAATICVRFSKTSAGAVCVYLIAA